MLLDLVKHHLKYHKSITLSYIGFLILLLSIINVQNILSFTNYYTNYYQYFEENQVDFVFDGDLIQNSSWTRKSIEDEMENGLIQKRISKMAVLLYYTLEDVNISIFNGNSSVFLNSVTIGTTIDDSFQYLNLFKVFSGNIPDDNEFIISSTTASQLDLPFHSVPLNISSKTGMNNYSFAVENQFSWRVYESMRFSRFINFFIPVESFIEWFREETVSILIIIQQNRDYVYDLYRTNENFKIASNFWYEPLEFDLTSGSISSPTANFFSQYSGFSSIDLESMFLVFPSIIIGLLFGVLLVNLWSKQFLQTWYYFKPRGLSYRTFSTSYLLYAISLAIIATPISSLLADIIENSLLLGFGATKLFFFSRFSNYLTLPLIISLIVAIWSFWRGMKHLEKLTIRETQTIQTDKSSFQWTRTVFWLGAIGIFLPFVVKSGIFSFSSISIAIELWFTIIFFVLIAITPIAFLLGTTGFIASKTSLIESIFMKLTNKLGFPTLKSSRGFNRQDIGFFIIIILSFQFFLTLTTTNLLYVDEQQSFNTYGASYTSEFSIITSRQVELMKTTVEREFPQITEIWTHELLICYESETGQKVFLYRFESIIPQSYKISSAKRNLLLEAINAKRGIILKSGKMFTDEKITVEIIEDSNMTFNLLKNQLFLPGFTYPEGEQAILESTLIPIPSEPNGIQVLIPDTIELLNVSLSRKIRFQFFSEEKSDNTVRQTIKSYFKEYTGEYIDVHMIKESDSAKELFYIIQTDLFTFFIIICFILLYMSELTTKKGELGPYLCRGYSLRKIRLLFLFEGIVLFCIAAISSLIIGSLLSAWVMVMVQYTNLFVILPVLPSNIILNLLSLILLFIIIYYLILRGILRTEPIANYMRKSY